ncbi:MAG: PhoH family protein [Myxococcota bacterium]|nr:PhoH family protein [Myxococcota bacterium]
MRSQRAGGGDNRGEQESLSFEVPRGAAGVTSLLGPQDAFRRLIERRLSVRIQGRGGQLSLQGSSVALQRAGRVLREMLRQFEMGQILLLHEIERLIALAEEDLSLSQALEEDELAARPIDGEELGDESLYGEEFPPRDGDREGGVVFTTYDNRQIYAKTPNQRRYLELIRSKDVVFSVGPAGTGKTYLAMAAAVQALRRHEVKRIILTRPAVEAGEKLGFLPGSLVEKINPYLRPLYDALFEMLGAEAAQRAIEEKTVEVAPLAFMRGRTLNQAFIILDEAQNTTREQMKMFLTRIGHGSRAIITGDITQTDLGSQRDSGLAHALRLLSPIDEIGVATLSPVDVVRHPLVRQIIRAYERDGDAQGHKERRTGEG